jgi:hypothetical protein
MQIYQLIIFSKFISYLIPLLILLLLTGIPLPKCIAGNDCVFQKEESPALPFLPLPPKSHKTDHSSFVLFTLAYSYFYLFITSIYCLTSCMCIIVYIH